MSAIDKIRSFSVAREPDVAVIRDGLSYGDARELIQEIDRMRAEVAETREACARICDERAKIAADARHDPSDDPWSQVQVAERLEAKLDEAESCAAAIRAGGKP